jgi:hypothetical protein
LIYLPQHLIYKVKAAVELKRNICRNIHEDENAAVTTSTKTVASAAVFVHEILIYTPHDVSREKTALV